MDRSYDMYASYRRKIMLAEALEFQRKQGITGLFTCRAVVLG
jgi:hypothetical protein